MGFLLASNVVASVLPSEQPNTRNRLLESQKNIASNVVVQVSWLRVLLLLMVVREDHAGKILHQTLSCTMLRSLLMMVTKNHASILK
jgi:hypothetical protein